MNKACFEKEFEVMFAGTPVQQNFFDKLCNRLQEAFSLDHGKENKMITNPSFINIRSYLTNGLNTFRLQTVNVSLAAKIAGKNNNNRNYSMNAQQEICIPGTHESQITECREREGKEETHPLKKYLRNLWINIKLFLETDKWKPIVTLKVGDSHRVLRMDDIEARWRNPNQ